ncbi:transformer-2 sex-determining protein-like isoform X3 [Sitodiplosis mosellana]|uniref:transformer-2 sex-determining protein-like isoform X3 n=1 Tax=Sitodiplosis mosellana TaxID=263140 RepID=UPI002443DBC7|nr:transformer-2 sex-determining protein-like isoform X3 [Sitodiplosis mosellana]
MQMQRFRDEPIAPIANGLYECTYIEKYRNLPTMDYCDLNHSERQMHKMRPRTPPLPPPVSRRNRSRSPRRRYRSPMLLHHDYHRSRDRPIDPYDDPNRNSNSRTRRSRGYCFVYFESMKSATRAVESSTNLRIDNRYVRVDYSITSRPRSSGSSDRYKDEVNRYASARNRSNHRRVHSPSPPRRYHR